ncbi:MAG: 50S ribosomal protein L31 [Mariprofundales bacterium]|nr:50S ribosomal protein L31 [Mariprofundales bacterium]
MKSGIHPEYRLSKVSCSCGNMFETRSTKGDMQVEICSNCHPFYTGKQKIVDTEGRVERFYKRYGNKSNGNKAHGSRAAATVA